MAVIAWDAGGTKLRQNQDDKSQRRCQEVSSQDVVDALLELVDRAGGKPKGATIVTDLGKVNSAFWAIVDRAGGP